MKNIYTALLCCCVFISIQGASQTWNGSVSSDWNNAANWTPNNVPTTSGNVIINNASASYQPVLGKDAGIRSLNMSAGVLSLNGFTLTCTVSATFTGDSLYNGKIVAATFNDLANMHLGGKITLDKTGASNEFWQGKNKFHGDSLIIIWRTGGLSMENAALSPDSIFGNLRMVYSDNNETTYRISIGVNSPIWIQNDLILDNPDKGTFGLDNSSEKIIGGSIKAIDFSNTVPNFPLVNVTVLGSNANGPFYAHTGSIDNCRFNGNFSFIADSSVTVNIINSSFLGADNLFQAGCLAAYGNKFGQSVSGTSILRAANNQDYNLYMRTGNNKFIGNGQWEAYAVSPGGLTMQHNWFGPDTCLKNLNFILKGNSALTTNNNGHNYVAGNVIIDGQGKRKWIEFSGGGGNTFTVDGSFTAKNFTSAYEPGISYIDLYLHNLYVNGTDTMGTFNCRTGNIQNSSFKGDFKLIADSNFVFSISSSSLLGTNNLIQSGTIDFNGNMFGQTGVGTTILRGAYNEQGTLYMRDGNNKFFGNVNIETYALYPGSITIQQTYYGQDTCLGNMNFILKGNSVLTTNGSGHNYVAGNVIIDGQGARKFVQFSGGAGVSFNVGGNFTAKNFTPFSEPGAGPTNVYLHHVYVTGTDTCGTFYCSTGDINGSSFNGDMKLIADSSQIYVVNNSFLSGANNLLQAGLVQTENNKFGQTGAGTTTLRSVLNAGNNYMRDGNNTFFGDALWDVTAPSSGSIIVQQTFFGADTCLGNVTINLGGPASANLGGANLYIGKGLSLHNNGSGVIVHDNGGSAIYFIGTDTASYFYSGSGSAPSLQNIALNRRGGLRLMSPLTCSGLTLTRGIILSFPSNPLKMPTTAAIVGGWDSSYVDGPMLKTGNTAFTFPLGRNNVYAPLSITAPSSATDAFTAQYFNHLAHADGYDTTQHDFSLNHLSRREYWTLSRTIGTSAVNVTLSWNAKRSGIVNAMTDLRVAHWNGMTWKDEGNGGTTGDNSRGSILSLNTINTFSPFTLASIGTSNPLPVIFTSFDVQLQNERTVLIRWTTSNEVNNDHFEVLRSNDLVTWTKIQTIFPEVSGVYSWVDENVADGINYYRIKQVDINGNNVYTQIKMINVQTDNTIFLWPNPAINELHLRLPLANGTIDITDEGGKVLLTRIIDSNDIMVSVRQFKAGVYFVRIKAGKVHQARKFVKI
jgi:hypothetical protein